MTPASRRAAVALGAAWVACVSAWPTQAPRPYHRTTTDVEAELVGAEECGICHEEVGGHAPAPTYHADCESCHGAGSEHIDSEEPGDVRFPADADCLACHEDGRSHLEWVGADHERSGVLCSDCHAPHNREPKHVRAVPVGVAAAVGHPQDTTRLCASCHVDVATRLTLPSHHPLAEGMLGCTDCHQPHGSRRASLGPPTEQCTSCHQDQAGPWIFEHPPAAEDCGYCHTPHGAVAEKLLVASEPGACLSCHTLPLLGATHDPAAFASRCTDCHGAIHGSYADPHLRR